MKTYALLVNDQNRVLLHSTGVGAQKTGLLPIKKKENILLEISVEIGITISKAEILKGFHLGKDTEVVIVSLNRTDSKVAENHLTLLKGRDFYSHSQSLDEQNRRAIAIHYHEDKPKVAVDQSRIRSVSDTIFAKQTPA